MKTKLLTGTIGAILLLSSRTYAQDKPSSTKETEAKGSGMSQDMREAIAWERAKDRAAARQAAIEARHPNADRSADRKVETPEDPSREVKDTNAPGAPKRKQ